MAVLFPTDLQRQQPSDEQVVLAAGNDNIAHNMRVGDLVNYVRENVPLETLIETNSSQQQTIETMAQTAEGKDATIAQLTANQAAPALESELAAGKTDLATAITAKGVQTAATDSLAAMADNVREIQTQDITIDGGEMYAKQLYGSLTPPKFWNLYDVLAQLLSDGRLSQYGGILLAEYYRGYDSLALSGAGTGGAYVVSDKGSDGQFVMHTEDTTHTWDVAFDGYGNRWVAYCFAGEYHDFLITDTNTSPRSIFIGRKVGEIKLLVNARISEIVVPDGNELKKFNPQTYTCPWNKKVSFRNIGAITSPLLYNPTSIEGLSIFCDGINAGSSLLTNVANCSFSLLLESYSPINGSVLRGAFDKATIPLLVIKAPRLNGTQSNPTIMYQGGSAGYTINELVIITEGGVFYAWQGFDSTTHGRTKRIYIGYIDNDKTKSLTFQTTSYPFSSVTDLQLQDNWCKPLNVALVNSLTEENMYTHILQRLKQNEPDCGNGVTITLGSTNLARLTSQDSQDLLATLRGTYGYTFA